MARSSRVHKVGLTAAAVGLLLVYALPFVTYRRSRIQSGTDSHIWQVAPWWLLIAIGLPWVVIAVLSIGNRRTRWWSFGRGMAAGVAVLATLWATDIVAATMLEAGGSSFGRVSISGGPWVVAFLSYTVIMASRRELEHRHVLRWIVTLFAPLGLAAMLAAGMLSDLGVVVEYNNVKEKFWQEAWIQTVVSAAAIAIASVAGIAFGLLAFLRPRASRAVFTTVNLFQTIPGLAMIGLLIGPLAALANTFPALRKLGIGGLGWAPLLISLVLYALLPIVRNTFEGLRGVPRFSIDAGLGMGMTRGQLLRQVELPIARPVTFSGIRTSAVQTVGNATLGAFVGGLGLGFFVVQGLSTQSTDQILLGSIAIVALALVVNGIMRLVQRAFTPKGLRKKEANQT